MEVKREPDSQKLTGHEAQQSFLWQFKYYTHGQYLFDTPLKDDQSTLSWWMQLTRISEGNILTVSPFVIYTILFTHLGNKTLTHGSIKTISYSRRTLYRVLNFTGIILSLIPSRKSSIILNKSDRTTGIVCPAV